MHTFYQAPSIEAPLDSDEDSGSPSDHLMVLFDPLNTINNKKTAKKETIVVRSYSDDNFRSMGRALEKCDWQFLTNIPPAEKMKAFHDKLFSMFDNCFPQKTKIIYTY